MFEELLYRGDIRKKDGDETPLVKSNVFLLKIDDYHYLDAKNLTKGKKCLYKIFGEDGDLFVDLYSLKKVEEKKTKKVK